MTVGPLSPLPAVGVTLWPAFAVTGKAGGALSAGNVAMTTDAVSWTAATTGIQDLKGVVMEDANKTSFVADDVITLLLIGVVVVVTDAAIAEGFPIEASSVVAAGRVRSYVVGADANDVTLAKVFGKALTTGGAAAKAAVMIGD